MAGFYVQQGKHLDQIRLLDLGASEIDGHASLGVTHAAWTYWAGSKQWHVVESPSRILLINGQVERLPGETEPLTAWLNGCQGSFRGWEIRQDAPGSPETLTIFTDPLGSRPIFYTCSDGKVAIADKLATLAMNAPLRPDWASLLETAALGTLYSHTTTIEGAISLAPGGMVEFQSGRLTSSRTNRLADLEIDTSRGPVETLRHVFHTAVNQAWNDPSAVLLLSGGYDSRAILAMAEGKRKALTYDIYPAETDLVRKVAADCAIDLQLFRFPELHWTRMLQDSYLLTGVTFASYVPTHLGVATQWRKSGISGLTHGYLHNTLFRGWTAGPYEKYPLRNSIHYNWMGRKGYYLDHYSCYDASGPPALWSALRPRGREMLQEQLRKFADELEIQVVDGIDVTFERRLLDQISRQVYFAVFLNWIEQIDVQSPVLHPIVWNWNLKTSPNDRHRDQLYYNLLRTIDHPAFRTPAFGSVLPIPYPRVSWQEKYRNQPWYPICRSVARLFVKEQVSRTGASWIQRMGNEEGWRHLERPVHDLADSEYFDAGVVAKLFQECRSGRYELFSFFTILSSLCQWTAFLRTQNAPESYVKTVPLQ